MKHLNPNLDNITNIEVDKIPVGDVRAIGIDDNNDIVLSSTDGGLMVPEGAPVTTPSSTTQGIVCSSGMSFSISEDGTNSAADPAIGDPDDPEFTSRDTANGIQFFDENFSQLRGSASNTLTLSSTVFPRLILLDGDSGFNLAQTAILNTAGIAIPVVNTNGQGGNANNPDSDNINSPGNTDFYDVTAFNFAYYNSVGALFSVSVDRLGVLLDGTTARVYLAGGGAGSFFPGTIGTLEASDYNVTPEGVVTFLEQATVIVDCIDPVRGDVSETPTTTVGPNGITTGITSCVVGPDTTTLTTVPVRSTTGWGGWTVQGPSERPSGTLLTQDVINNIEINAEDSLVSVASGGGQVYPPPQAPNNFEASGLQQVLFTSLGLVEATLQALNQGGQSIVNAPTDFTAFNTRFVTADGAEFTVLVSSAYFSRGSTKLYLGGTGDAPASGPASRGTGFRNFTTEDFTISPSGTYNVSTTNNTAPYDFDTRIDSTVDVDIVCTMGPSTTITPGDLTTTGDINVGGDLTVTGDTNIVPNAGTVPASWADLGTVTNVATGTGLTGGPITTTGTIDLDSASIASLLLADSALQQSDVSTNGSTSITVGTTTFTPAGGTTINATANNIPVWDGDSFEDSPITLTTSSSSFTFDLAIPFTGTAEQNQANLALQQDSDLVIADGSSAFRDVVDDGAAWSIVTHVHFDNRNSGSFWERTSNAASAAFVQGITTDSFIVLYTDDNNWAVISPISTNQVANSLNVSVEASMGITPTIGTQITIGFIPSATYPLPAIETTITGGINVTGLLNAADDAAAATAGVPVNGLYRNGSQLMIRIS